MDVAASNRVVARNGIGRFIAECELAATETIEEIVTDGANLSKDLAPERTGQLKASIQGAVLSRTSGQWIATAPWALPQETGGRPHPIPGNPNLAFFWEKKGRNFIPASVYYGIPGAVTEVSHPGNPAKHYLLNAYKVMAKRATRIAASKYPG